MSLRDALCGISIEREKLFLDISSSHFSFNEHNHGTFKIALEESMNELKISFVKWGKTFRSSWSRNKSKIWVRMIYLNPPLEPCVYAIERHQYDSVITRIFSEKHWHNTVTSKMHIPSTIHRACSVARISMESVFRHLDSNDYSAIPYYVDRNVCSMRIIQFRQRNNIEQEQRQEELDDDSDCSSNVTSNMNEFMEDESSVSMCMLPTADRVEIADRKTSIHPYALSATVFCLADHYHNILKETNKTSEMIPSIAELYKLIKDELAFERNNSSNSNYYHSSIENVVQHILIELMKKRMPESSHEAYEMMEFCKLYEAGMRRLYKIDDMLLRDIAGMLDFFGDIQYMMIKQMISNKKRICVKRGKLEEVKTNKKANGKVYISFDRSRTNALDLFTTVKLLGIRFPFLSDSCLTVEFDDNGSYIVADSDRPIHIIQTYIIPYLCSSHPLILRTKYPCPLYMLHLKNFIDYNPHDDDTHIGLLMSMRSLLKTFVKNNTKNKAWPSIGDPLLDFYSVLPIILNRFEDRATILDMLIDPLLDPDNIRFKSRKRKSSSSSPDEDIVCGEKKATGFVESRTTLYSALKSFCYVRCRHMILRTCVLDLANLFIVKDRTLQHKYRLQFELIMHLRDKIDNSKIYMDIIDVPEDFYDDNEFPFPSHVALYYLCCSSSLDNNTAVNLFLSLKLKSGESHTGDDISFSANYPNLDNMQEVRYKLMDLISRTVASKQERKDDKSIDNNQNHGNTAGTMYNGLATLFQAVEELSYYPVKIAKSSIDDDNDYRGNKEKRLEMWYPVPWLKAMTIPNECFPMQFSEDNKPQYSWGLFPVWTSEMNLLLDNNAKRDCAVMSGRKFYESNNQNGNEIQPLAGANDDFMSSIIISPCTSSIIINR
jgi:hypothetical protein